MYSYIVYRTCWTFSWKGKKQPPSSPHIWIDASKHKPAPQMKGKGGIFFTMKFILSCDRLGFFISALDSLSRWAWSCSLSLSVTCKHPPWTKCITAVDTTTPFLIFMTYYFKTSLNIIKYATLTATKYGRAIKLAKHKGKGVLSILCSLTSNNIHRIGMDYKIKRNLNSN